MKVQYTSVKKRKGSSVEKRGERRVRGAQKWGADNKARSSPEKKKGKKNSQQKKTGSLTSRCKLRGLSRGVGGDAVVEVRETTKLNSKKHFRGLAVGLKCWFFRRGDPFWPKTPREVSRVGTSESARKERVHTVRDDPKGKHFDQNPNQKVLRSIKSQKTPRFWRKKNLGRRLLKRRTSNQILQEKDRAARTRFGGGASQKKKNALTLIKKSLAKNGTSWPQPSQTTPRRGSSTNTQNEKKRKSPGQGGADKPQKGSLNREKIKKTSWEDSK